MSFNQVSSVKSPEDFNYSKEDVQSNEYQSSVYEPNRRGSPLDAFLSQEVSASAGEGRATHSNGLHELSQMTEAVLASSSYFRNPPNQPSKNVSQFSNDVSNVTSANVTQQFLLDRDGRWEQRYSLQVKSGTGQPALLPGAAEGTSNGSYGQGLQAIGHRLNAYAEPKTGAVDQQRSKYLKLNTDEQVSRQISIQEGRNGHSNKMKDVSSDSQHKSRGLQRKEGELKSDLNANQEKEDYDDYVAGLKREHGQYQSKLRELQNRIQHLNEFNQQRINITTLDQARRPHLLKKGLEHQDRTSDSDQAASLENRIVERSDNTKYQGTHSLGELAPDAQKTRTAVDVAKFRQIPQYILKTRKIEEYDLEQEHRGDSNMQNQSHQTGTSNAHMISSSYGHKRAPSDALNKEGRSRSPQRKGKHLTNDQLKYEPLRIRLDQDVQSPQLFDRLQTLKTYKDEGARGWADSDGQQLGKKSTGSGFNQDTINTTTYINQVVDKFNKNELGDNKGSDFQANEQQDRWARDLSPSVGGVTSLDRAVSKSGERSGLQSKPLYKTYLAQRDQAHLKYRFGQEQLDEVGEGDLSQISQIQFQEEHKKENRSPPETQNRNKDRPGSSLRVQKRDPFAQIEPKQMRKQQSNKGKNQRSQSARRDRRSSESRGRRAYQSKQKNEGTLSISTPLNETQNAAISASNIKGLRGHRKLGQSLTRQPSKSRSNFNMSNRRSSVPRLRSDAPAAAPQNDRPAAHDASEVDQAIEEKTKNSKYRLYQLEKQFNQQKTKSKDKIEQMQRKIEQLQQINQSQHEKIKALAAEKVDTLSNVETMHEKLKHLNQRLASQNELFKQGKGKDQKKTEELERRIQALMQGVKEAQKKAMKKAPLQRRKRKDAKYTSSKSKDKRKTSLRKRNKLERQRSAEKPGLTHEQKNSSYQFSQKSSVSCSLIAKDTSRKGSQRSINARLYSPRPEVALEEVELKLKKNSSPRPDPKLNTMPFVPLRNQSNRQFAERKIKQSFALQQDNAEPEAPLPHHLNNLLDSTSNTVASDAPLSIHGSSRDNVARNKSNSSKKDTMANSRDQTHRVKRSSIGKTGETIHPRPPGGSVYHVTHSSSKSQMTFGESRAEGLKPSDEALRPYEDRPQNREDGAAVQLAGHAHDQRQKQLLDRRHQELAMANPNSRQYMPRKAAGTATSSGDQLGLSPQANELIGEQLLSPGTNSTVVNPFSGSRGSNEEMMRSRAYADKPTTSSEQQRQDDLPVKYSENGYTYSNKYQEHSVHPLRVPSTRMSPAGKDGAPAQFSNARRGHLAAKINVESASPLRKATKPQDRSEESIHQGESPTTNADTVKLQSLVLELAGQVKGLKSILNNEIEGKKQNDQKMFNIQDRYFQTLDELKQDLGDFKKRMEHENKFIKEEFLGQRGGPRTLQVKSSSDNSSNLGSRAIAGMHDQNGRKVADFRPPQYPADANGRQMNTNASPVDSDAALPNNHRDIQAQYSRATGVPSPGYLPSRSNRTDHLAGMGAGLPADSRSASYTGSGNGMMHDDGRMTYQLDGQPRSHYSQNYDNDLAQSEEQQRIAYYSNKPQVDEPDEQQNDDESHQRVHGFGEAAVGGHVLQEDRLLPDQQQLSGQVGIQDYDAEGIESGNYQIQTGQQSYSSRDAAHSEGQQAEDMAMGHIEAMEQDLIRLQQDTQDFDDHQEDDDDVHNAKRGLPNDEPMFNDQFQAYQKMQDEQHFVDDERDVILPYSQPAEHQQESRPTPDREQASEGPDHGSSNRYKRGTGQPGKRGGDHTPMHSLAQ